MGEKGPETELLFHLKKDTQESEKKGIMGPLGPLLFLSKQIYSSPMEEGERCLV